MLQVLLELFVTFLVEAIFQLAVEVASSRRCRISPASASSSPRSAPAPRCMRSACGGAAGALQRAGWPRSGAARSSRSRWRSRAGSSSGGEREAWLDRLFPGPYKAPTARGPTDRPRTRRNAHETYDLARGAAGARARRELDGGARALAVEGREDRRPRLQGGRVRGLREVPDDGHADGGGRAQREGRRARPQGRDRLRGR